MFLPFKPVRGQAFTLSFLSATTTSIATTATAVGVSKDGGAFAITTNSPTFITRISGSERMYATIALTATEMDADVVVVYPYQASSPGNIAQAIIIYTTSAELSAAPTLNSSLEDKIKAIFQYLFFKRTVTATVETLKKSDASTTLGTATVSDDGTTFTKGAIS